MRKLTATLCLTLALFLGSVGVSAGGEFEECIVKNNCDDYAMALRKLKPLAEQGDASAQAALGELFWVGGRPVGSSGRDYISKMVKSDHKKSVKWLALAAEQGHARAQFLLGNMYTSGRGVTKDDVYGYMWINIAASNGSEMAIDNRPHIEKRLTPSQLEKAQDLARECVRKKYKGC